MNDGVFSPTLMEWIFFGTATAATIPMVFLIRWIWRELRNEPGPPPL